MRIVIVGIGDVGWALVESLTSLGRHELVLIDDDPDRAEQASNAFDALVLEGDGTDPTILGKAELDDADALVATTGSDAINTVITMLGHRAGVETIVVKLRGVGLRAACQEIGVSKIIAPKISAAAEIVETLHGFHSLDFSVVARGGLQLVELDAGTAAGQTASELELPDGALIVSVLRDDQVLIPRGGTRIQANDVLLTLVQDKANLDAVRKLLALESSDDDSDETR